MPANCHIIEFELEAISTQHTFDQPKESLLKKSISFKLIPSRRTLQELLTCMLLFLTYFGVTITATAISVSFPSLVADEKMQMDKSQIGILVGFGNAGYFLGSLIMGFATDKIGGRNMAMISVILTVGTSVLFGWMRNQWLLRISLFAEKFVQAGAWPALTRIIREWFDKKKLGTVFGVVSFGSRFASVFANLTLGAAIASGLHWRGAIFVATGTTLLLSLSSSFFLQSSAPKTDEELEFEKKVQTSESQQNCIAKPEHPFDKLGIFMAFLHTLKSMRFWLILVNYICATVVMELNNYASIYLKEAHNLNPGIASTLSSAFAIGCMLSVFIGGTLYDKLGTKLKFIALTATTLVATGCCATLWICSKSLNLYASVLIVLLLGGTISPCYYLPVNVFSVVFGGQYCGTLVNLINSLGSAAAIIFAVVAGHITETLGWNCFFAITTCISLIATITIALFLYIDHFAESGKHKFCT